MSFYIFNARKIRVFPKAFKIREYVNVNEKQEETSTNAFIIHFGTSTFSFLFSEPRFLESLSPLFLATFLYTRELLERNGANFGSR